MFAFRSWGWSRRIFFLKHKSFQNKQVKPSISGPMLCITGMMCNKNIYGYQRKIIHHHWIKNILNNVFIFRQYWYTKWECKVDTGPHLVSHCPLSTWSFKLSSQKTYVGMAEGNFRKLKPILLDHLHIS